jgi:hypothetical protein
MARPYTKVNWTDNVTPENATTLGKMDQGIKDVDDALVLVETGKQAISEKGQVNGYASLDGTGKVPLAQLPPISSGGGIDYENDWSGAVPYAAGDVVKFNGVEYLAVNPSTNQAPTAPAAPPSSLLPIALVTALPASPFDGQEVILTDSLTAGTYQWRLRYVAGRASNKWLFIGGSPASAEVVTPEAISSATYVALATPGPSLAAPVAGDYFVSVGCDIKAGASGTGYMSYDVGGTTASDNDMYAGTGRVSTEYAGGTRLRRKSLAAGAVLVAKYRTSVSVTFANRLLTLVPVAVGG